jgi:hypothetical protein
VPAGGVTCLLRTSRLSPSSRPKAAMSPHRDVIFERSQRQLYRGDFQSLFVEERNYFAPR